MNTPEDSPASGVVQAIREGMTPIAPEVLRERLWPESAGFVSVCAWCTPGVGGPNVTHGICAKHQAEMREEIEAFKRAGNAA